MTENDPGAGTDPDRRQAANALPYRILIAGDFGIDEEGAVLDPGGEDVAALLAGLAPAIGVDCANLLGSDPAEVSATVTLAAPSDLLPEGLLAQFPHYSDGVRAAAASAGNGSARVEAVGRLVAQAKAFLSAPRLARVVENWSALALFMKETDGAAAPQVHLAQIRSDADEAALSRCLAGEDGALSQDLYDVVLLADPSGIGDGAAGKLASLADAAQATHTVALASLEAGLAGRTPEEIAGLDMPQEIAEGPGFVAFNALRSQDRARHLAVFWNDVLLRPESDGAPALYVPAAWVALIMIADRLAKSGWPELRDKQHYDLPDLATTTIRVGDSDVASTTRAGLSPDCCGGLAAIGISALSGEPDSKAVSFSRTPVLRAGSDGKHYIALSGRLVLARLNALLQSVLIDNLDRSLSAEDAAQALQARFSELSASLVHHPEFAVKPTAGSDGRQLIDISVSMPEAFADSRSFSFQVPL